MTKPAVPIVRNIADLRRLWPEWSFEKTTVRWGIRKGFPFYTARGEYGLPLIVGATRATAAEAAQALAERLEAAGHEARMDIALDTPSDSAKLGQS